MAGEYKAVTGFPPQIHRGISTRFGCLDDLVMVGGPCVIILITSTLWLEGAFMVLCLQIQLCPEKDKYVDRILFVSLLTMMLQLNPWKRITPSEALIHPFLTLSDVGEDDTISQ